MVYNMTPFSTANNPYLMFEAVNTASDNWLSYLVLIATFVILLMTLMRRNPPAESLTSASAVCTVLSLFLVLANLINTVWVVGFTLIFGLSAIGLYITNKT